ncbi:hypothetical protein UY3_10820 [Chelonia mydas]|uniref:Uncharacterized protein n=1 Tax=Chelonia mydas TaxID=8469 RepID=M7BV92_CHEMY|nr:hypothetical protein UY3_10820 [Chelonia mydas]
MHVHPTCKAYAPIRLLVYKRGYKKLLSLVCAFWFTKECHVRPQLKADVTLVIGSIVKFAFRIPTPESQEQLTRVWLLSNEDQRYLSGEQNLPPHASDMFLFSGAFPEEKTCELI